ncbi:MAG: hypothetical protein P4M00_18780 [Azospirillaceae bacterium]|nr:hypothetical protein [Azospirillaceae bacterium]
MAKVADERARLADGIATARRQRGELVAEIRIATTSRHGEVGALLKSLKMSRDRAGREWTAEIRSLTKMRHGEVRSMLGGLAVSRGAARLAYQAEATAANRGRQSDVKELLSQFAHQRVVCRQHRLELSAVQRANAVAFMRDLTDDVAALCDRFGKERRERAGTIHDHAGAIHERLTEFALQRGGAGELSGAPSHQESETVAHDAEAHRAPDAALDDTAPEMPDPPIRSSRRAPATVSHRGASDRLGGDGK